MAKVKIFLELWHGEEGEKEKKGGGYSPAKRYAGRNETFRCLTGNVSSGARRSLIP